MSTLYLRVVGVSFGNRQAVLNEVNVGDPLRLVPEPDNPFDRNAVRVETTSGELVGYVPRDLAPALNASASQTSVSSKGRSRSSGLIGITIAVAFSAEINAAGE